MRKEYMPSKKSAEPWEKPVPKKSKHTKLTPASKAKAKRAAKKAGRKYPSLVDNMNATKKQRGTAEKKPGGKKSSAKSPSAKSRKKSTTRKSKSSSKTKTSRAKKA
jgi:hypothetical protein